MGRVQLLVDDMGDVTNRVEDFGGSVIEAPANVGEYGIGAEIADPSGGRVNVWQAFQSGPTIKHEHGSMQWCELMTPDPDAAAAFFRRLLHLHTDVMEMPDGSSNYIVHTQDGPVMSISALGGLSDELIEAPRRSDMGRLFQRRRCGRGGQTSGNHGGELPDPPWDVPGIGRMAWVYDPHGALVALTTPAGN